MEGTVSCALSYLTVYPFSYVYSLLTCRTLVPFSLPLSFIIPPDGGAFGRWLVCRWVGGWLGRWDRRGAGRPAYSTFWRSVCLTRTCREASSSTGVRCPSPSRGGWASSFRFALSRSLRRSASIWYADGAGGEVLRSRGTKDNSKRVFRVFAPHVLVPTCLPASLPNRKSTVPTHPCLATIPPSVCHHRAFAPIP